MTWLGAAEMCSAPDWFAMEARCAVVWIDPSYGMDWIDVTARGDTDWYGLVWNGLVSSIGNNRFPCYNESARGVYQTNNNIENAPALPERTCFLYQKKGRILGRCSRTSAWGLWYLDFRNLVCRFVSGCTGEIKGTPESLEQRSQQEETPEGLERSRIL